MSLSTKISWWMNSASPPRRAFTCSAMSTTGPQTRLWHSAGRGEQQDHRLLAHHVREVGVVHRGGRLAGVDALDVAPCLRLRGRVDPRSAIADIRHAARLRSPSPGRPRYRPRRGGRRGAPRPARRTGRACRTSRRPRRATSPHPDPTRPSGSGTGPRRRATRSAPRSGPWPCRRPRARRTGPRARRRSELGCGRTGRTRSGSRPAGTGRRTAPGQGPRRQGPSRAGRACGRRPSGSPQDWRGAAACPPRRRSSRHRIRRGRERLPQGSLPRS